MDNRTKVINTIEALESAKKSLLSCRSALEKATDDLSRREGELIRTLHAVYGSGSSHGVVYGGQRYSTNENSLKIEKVKFDYLG